MDFRESFENLCREVIRPTLLRVVTEHARTRGAVLSLDVIDGPGPTARNPSDIFADNRRVILKIAPLGELWFVGWDPEVILQPRHGGQGPVSIYTLGAITSAVVEDAARRFIESACLAP